MLWIQLFFLAYFVAYLANSEELGRTRARECFGFPLVFYEIGGNEGVVDFRPINAIFDFAVFALSCACIVILSTSYLESRFSSLYRAFCFDWRIQINHLTWLMIAFGFIVGMVCNFSWAESCYFRILLPYSPLFAYCFFGLTGRKPVVMFCGLAIFAGVFVVWLLVKHELSSSNMLLHLYPGLQKTIYWPILFLLITFIELTKARVRL